jgi:hypothetical protein
MVVVATLVCGFAVGMSGLLNYFKYRSTMHGMVTERVNATGRSVENSIGASLRLGLLFSEIGTLPGTLQRERATDDVITGIDVFDTEGTILYTTDVGHSAGRVPPEWLAVARKVGPEDTWFVDGKIESATGMSVDNDFGLRVGYIALRYSNARVQQSMYEAGRQIAIASFSVFIVAAALSSLALLAVMRRLGSDVSAVESALRAVDPVRASTPSKRGLFGPALHRFLEMIRTAETEIASVRALLRRGESQ